MPGPVSAWLSFLAIDVRDYHSKCQQKQACTGPGCQVVTGKTGKRRGRKRAKKTSANR